MTDEHKKIRDEPRVITELEDLINTPTVERTHKQVESVCRKAQLAIGTLMAANERLEPAQAGVPPENVKDEPNIRAESVQAGTVTPLAEKLFEYQRRIAELEKHEERIANKNARYRETLETLIDKVEQYAESGCIEGYTTLERDRRDDTADLSTAVDEARAALRAKPEGDD